VEPALRSLQLLTQADSVERARVDAMARLAVAKLAELRETIALHDSAGAAAALELVRGERGERGEKLTREYRQLSALVSRAERARLEKRMTLRDEQHRGLALSILLSGLAALLVTGAALWRTRRVLADRMRLESIRERQTQELAMQSEKLEEQNEELKAQREALRSAMRAAEGASQAKSTFLAQMSHELRTPLNSVIGFTNIVRRNPRGTLTDAELTYLERVLENGRQLLRTIDSILDLSKIEARREEVELQPVALDELIAEIVAHLEPQAAAAELRLSFEVPSPLERITTDPEKLRRVMINLVANAMKFTKPGGYVLVRVEASEREPQVARAVEVHDNGAGIAASRLAAIFDAFEQGDVGVSREYGGTGLGLSISRALCRLLGCELSVISRLGRGSVFRVALPSAPAVHAPHTAFVADRARMELPTG
jgi:signal transduction histidine kinase